MTFRTFSKLTDLQNEESLRDIEAAMADLRSLMVDVVDAEGSPLKPKIVWKIESYLQGVLYRTVALCEGVKTCWNEGNLLAAVILGRSLMETAAAAFDFHQRITKGVRAENLSAIDDAVMQYTFATRSEKFDNIAPAPNVLSLIDRLDGDFLKDRKAGDARKLYEFLSEFAHPNWAGTVGLFGEIVQERLEHRFAESNTISDKMASQVIAAIGSIRIVQLCYERAVDHLPQVAEISNANTPPSR